MDRNLYFYVTNVNFLYSIIDYGIRAQHSLPQDLIIQRGRPMFKDTAATSIKN